MKVSVGKYEMLCSATLFQIGQEPIRVELPLQEIQTEPLVMLFVFESSNNFLPRTQLKTLDNNTLQFTFVNYHYGAVMSSRKLYELGFIGKKKLFFTFRFTDMVGDGLNMITEREVGRSFDVAYYLA